MCSGAGGSKEPRPYNDLMRSRGRLTGPYRVIVGFRVVLGLILTAGLVSSAGCGLLDDPRPVGQGSELHPNATGSHDRATPGTSDHTTVNGEPSASTTAEQPRAPEGTRPQAPPPETEPVQPSGGTVPSGGTDDGLDAFELVALDRCRRVGDFENAGTALFDAAVGRAVMGRDVVERVLVALADLEPVVDEDGRAILEEFSRTAVPEIRDVLRNPAGVQVAEVRGVIDRIAPQITTLMAHLRVLCPVAVGEDTVDMTQRVHLGQPLP